MTTDEQAPPRSPDPSPAISATAAIELAAKHVAAILAVRIREQADRNVRDGWPRAPILSPVPPEPVWSIWIPSEQPAIGGSRVIGISKRTGEVIFDAYVGE